jgi:ABC-type glycerol-3-phosphate transport system substrate-binding protein
LAAALLGACGLTPAEQAAPASTGPVPLLYWSQRAPNDRLGNGVLAALDDYQAKNPGRVTLEVGEGGAALSMERIKAAMAAGTAPDLYGGLFQSTAAELFLLGGVVDLNAELKNNREWGRVKGEIAPSVLDGCSWRGKLPFVPQMLATQLRGFSKAMLTKAGVPLPRQGYTWDEFIEIGRKTAQPPDVVLFHFQYDWSEFGRWLYSNGQRVMNADRTKALFDTPVAIDTLQWLHDQVTRTGMARGGALNFAHFNNGASVTDSVNEAAAMLPPRYPNVDPGDGSGIYATHYAFGPGNTSRQLLQGGNSYGYILMKTADPKKVAAAAQIAAWSLRADTQAKVAEASGHPPPNTIAARDENLPRRIKENPILKTINDVSKNLYLVPNLPNWTQGMTILTDGLQRLFKGEVRPRDVLVEAQPRIQALVDEDLKRG